MVTRRRMFSIIAGCLAAPASARADHRWHGQAMGAEAQVLLSSYSGNSFKIFRQVEQIITRVETTFSLYVDSELTRLNATGILRNPTQYMTELLALVDRVHAATAGVFDPTVQPLWKALARGDDGVEQRALVGWLEVKRAPDLIALPPGFQLTLNGIAQGFCADKVAMFLRNEGFQHVLVDTGELLALDGQSDGSAWPVWISSEAGEILRRMPLNNRALATSSPLGTRLAKGEPHILGPQGQVPQWRTVAVSAASAALADALSTAACLLPRAAIDQALSQFPQVRLEAIA